MESENKAGQIQVFAKNIKGKAKGQIVEESKKTKNTAGEFFFQNGKNGGIKNDKNQKRRLSTELKVLKVEGPFEDGKKVEVLEKNKWYTYKVTKFNREPTKNELQNLRWGVKYDNEKLRDLTEVSCKSYVEITHKVLENNNASKLRMYAFFKAPEEKGSVETYLIKEDVIIIIGTEQHSTNIANKLMFAGEAVRKVRIKYSKHPFLKIALFTDGYTDKQLSAITNSLIQQNKRLVVIKVATVDDVINIINYGNKEKRIIDNARKVKEIIAYSHGYIRNTNEGVIAFGYEGKNATKQELDIHSFSKVNPKVFLEHNKSNFYSYACRTGIGTNSETTTDPVKDKSLAQKMANYGKIIVYGYMRRSLYEDAWGSQAHRDTYASDNDAGDSSWENFKTDIKDIYKSDPKDMKAFNNYRKKEIKVDGAIWNPDGAYLDVKAGSWPVGVPSTYNKYIPK